MDDDRRDAREVVAIESEQQQACLGRDEQAHLVVERGTARCLPARLAHESEGEVVQAGTFGGVELAPLGETATAAGPASSPASVHSASGTPAPAPRVRSHGSSVPPHAARHNNRGLILEPVVQEQRPGSGGGGASRFAARIRKRRARLDRAPLSSCSGTSRRGGSCRPSRRCRATAPLCTRPRAPPMSDPTSTTSRATRRRRPAATCRAPPSSVADGPSLTRSISASDNPHSRAINTCWPHSYLLMQFQPVRRIRSSRSRAGRVFFDRTWAANTNHRRSRSGWWASVPKMLSTSPSGRRIPRANNSASRGSSVSRRTGSRGGAGGVVTAPSSHEHGPLAVGRRVR